MTTSNWESGMTAEAEESFAEQMETRAARRRSHGLDDHEAARLDRIAEDSRANAARLRER